MSFCCRLVRAALALALSCLFIAPVFAQEVPIDNEVLLKSGTPPKPIKRVAPVYPAHLRRAGIGGSVNVAFVINPAGGVQDARVLESDNKGLEQAALKAIKQWKFTPGQLNGQPVSSRHTQLLSFNSVVDGQSAPKAQRKEQAHGAPVSQHPSPSVSPDSAQTEPVENDVLLKDGTLPKPIKRGAPIFPAHLRRVGKGGSVKVSFVINQAGAVQDVRVVESNNKDMEQPVIAAVKRWKFIPGQLNGRSVSSRHLQQIDYSVDGSGPADDGSAEQTQHAPESQRSVPSTPPASASQPVPAQPVQAGPFDADFGAAVLRDWVQPEYPAEARKAGLEGTVVVEFVVELDGSVSRETVRESTDERFNAAALAAVK